MNNGIIGIVGAGVMGRGVAQRFASYGYSVILIDIEHSILDMAKNEILRSLQFQNMFGGKKLDVTKIMEKIVFSTSYDKLNAVNFVIENVSEKKELKKQVYNELNNVCNQDCYFLANTSCISITELGAFSQRPERVIGVHFMNPVPQKDFSEVIRGMKTSEETITSVKGLLDSVGISCEVINDNPGFVSNRLSHLFMNEAIKLVQEGVAEPSQIDAIFKKGFGHTMGPLETADLIGLDTVMDSLDVLAEAYQDSRYSVCPLLRRMVAAGMLGRKSRQGFYKY